MFSLPNSCAYTPGVGDSVLGASQSTKQGHVVFLRSDVNQLNHSQVTAHNHEPVFLFRFYTVPGV